jgi:hypothetical protein
MNYKENFNTRMDYLRSLDEEFKKAAVAFWKGHKPVSFTEEEHLENPTVNAWATDSEKRLCEAIGLCIKEGIL